jgi:folate-binding protein YgfZ
MIELKSDLRAEYEAIRHGIAVIDFSSAGKLQLRGKNAVQFLNGMVSNDVKALGTGDGLLAAFPSLQGKLVALCRIYNTGAYMLIELEAINREKIFKNLNRFVAAGEFFVTDVSDQYGLLSLQGPRSAELIENLFGETISDQVPYKIREKRVAQTDVLIAVHNRCGGTGFDLFIPAEAVPFVRDAILSRGREFGPVEAVGEETFEIARIEAGIPRDGIDAGEDYIILESELNEAVSYTKGCYLGQEVIARIHWRGQPAKRLRGLLVDADQAPQRGTMLFAGDGKKVGQITSSTYSIGLDRLIALAYVHRYYLNPGTEFTLKEGDLERGRAQLVELPFVRTKGEYETNEK